MALDGTHTVGSSGHVSDHNLIDQTLADHATQLAAKLNSVDAASTYMPLGSLVLNVKDYGAKGDGVTDDTAAIQAAINAAQAVGYGTVFLPAGAYMTSSTLTISSTRIRLLGSGRMITIIRGTSATASVITVTGSASYCTISDLWLSRSVTATNGYGISAGLDGAPAYMSLFNLYIDKQWNGLRLGPANYSTVRDTIIEGCQSDGIFMTNNTVAATMQWQLEKMLIQGNGGRGIRVFAQDLGSGGITLGNWSTISTYANNGNGISLEGTASTPINGLRLNSGFIGGDGASEIYLNTYGGYHILSDVFTELCGSATTGPTNTPATGVGHGIEITTNNVDVQISGGLHQQNSYCGISTGAAKTQVNGVRFIGNGTTATAGANLHSGVYNAAGRLAMTGCQTSGQQYGEYTAVDSVLVVGNDLGGNTTAATGAGVTLSVSVVANNRTA